MFAGRRGYLRADDERLCWGIARARPANEALGDVGFKAARQSAEGGDEEDAKQAREARTGHH